MNLLPCHPIVSLPQGPWNRGRMQCLRDAAAPSDQRITQLPDQGTGSAEPNVSGHLSAPYYTVCTVGLNKSGFRSLDPRTESTTEVHEHMVMGPGVLDPGITRSSARTCCLATPLSPYPRVLRTEVSDGVDGMPQHRRPRRTIQLPATWFSGTSICLAQCIRPIISPLLHCFYCLVKHVCVPASGSANQQCHRWLCPWSTKSHGRGTWCLRARDPTVPVWTCCVTTPLSPYPRVLRTDVSDGVYGTPQPVGPEEPPSCQPLGSPGPESVEPNVPAHLSAPHYIVLSG